jgi:metal-responsive CopG/Arc/MetJ family transcriptional regulator
MKKREEEPMVERIVVPLTADLSEALETYWHERRYRSKSEAVRHLLRIAFEVEMKTQVRKK